MFRSIVLFTWNDDADEQRVKTITTELGKLPGLIPGLARLDCGVDAGVRPGNADYGVCADFERAEDYQVYLEHPAHLAVVTEHIRPLIAGRAAVQFEF